MTRLQLKTVPAFLVWCSVCLVTVDSFTTLTKPQTLRSIKLYSTNSGGDDRRVTFRYAPSSLLHLKNVELPADYSRPWTTQKLTAASGALVIGGALGLGTNVILSSLMETDSAETIALLVGAAGLAGGWFLLGGKEITDAEMPKNGGYDAKLVADRPARLKATIDFLNKHPGVVMQETLSSKEDELLPYITRVHDDNYVQELKSKSMESDRPRRLNPLYARTLIDEHSYDAAVQAVGAWIQAVDAALDEQPPTFCLVRPPSHHACRGKGKGGCLFNSVAIAAFYALDQPGVNHVAILDMDAHHGNGIAHCVQDEPRIRYCSIHEDTNKQQPLFGETTSKTSADDPRSPSSDDHGPLDNILNINLPTRTGWDNGYAEALNTQAMPFLCENEPEVLLVAAGFDALCDDWSSSLQLQTCDYEKLGEVLKERFGNRLAFGLEGGYAYQDGQLAQAIYEFVKPWKQS